MSDICRDRHAKLGCMVLELFPKVMQMILKYYETPAGLKQKYLKQNFCFVFTEKETVLMNKLPNMDEFTIELCYKILRSENRLDEPKCKWGNVPHDIELEISDDIQRLINATNSILRINSEEVTKTYFEKLMDEIKLIVTRGDSFLQQDVVGSLYNSLRRTDIDSYSVLQDLTRIKAIDEAEFLPDTESEKRERYSRLSMAVIDTFPNILRDVIRSNKSASDLYLLCNNHIDYFTPAQQENLRQLQYSNTYSSLDVTLIYRLLRQFKMIPPPTKGWGAIPDKADTTLADDIERIRCHRNQIAHRCDTNIDTNMFDDYFDNFQNIGRRMDLIFFQKTNFEQQMIGHRTRRIDTKMLKKYENAMKEIENIQLRITEKPIKFYWGRSFDECLMNLRSLIKEEKIDGKQKVRLQIIFQNENDAEKTIHILNSLRDEINKDLSGIEFIIATKGSIILNVDVLVEILETDEMLRLILTLFLAKILESITSSITDSADMVLLPAEEYTHWHNENTIREPVYLDFNIDAKLFVIDDAMEQQISKISYAISKCINGDGKNKDSTATLLPINLEFDAIKISSIPLERPFEVPPYRPDIQCCGRPTPCSGSGEMGVTPQPETRPKESTLARSISPNATIRHTMENITTKEDVAQTPTEYNIPVSVNLLKQLNLRMSGIKDLSIHSCIKTGYTLVFTECMTKQILICNVDGTDIHHIPLPFTPYYITVINIHTVAVSCGVSGIILIINISTRSVIRTINTRDDCWVISYNDNNLYVGIGKSIIHVIELTGEVIRTISVPSNSISDITVDRDRLVYTDFRAIYCCALDGKLIWKKKIYDFRNVTTDGEGNVYMTNINTHSVVVVSDDGKHHGELLTGLDGLNRPLGIYFDKKENVLLVCNVNDGKAFLLAVKKNIRNEHVQVYSD